MKCIPMLLLAAATLSAQEWPAYGNDGGGSRYSPLTQITRANVAQLKVAWTYHTHALDAADQNSRKSAFETTPIMVGGRLYFTTPFSEVIALNAATGAEIWKFDPHIDRARPWFRVTSRGVATWVDNRQLGEDEKPGPCRRRIFLSTIDGRLIALDAADGKPCENFGTRGGIDLTIGVGMRDLGAFQETSPPAVIHDLVIVGSSLETSRRFDVEKGTVRAYNARSGKLEWIWEPIPIDKPTGAANAWSMISVDVARNLVFVPTASASPAFYGARRAGENRNANSVVALDALTGQMIWRFQAVHHDLWEYDIASQPALVSVHGNGKEQAAIAINTKMGNLFILDRNTGVPIYPVTDRQVPRSDVPSEESFPTQPYPSNPPITPQSLRASEVWGLTPEDKEACKQLVLNLRSEGLFTPPSVQGSVQYPGDLGAANWGSSAYDPPRGLLIVPVNRVPTIARVVAREKFAAEKTTGTSYVQAGTAFGAIRETLAAPSGLPCSAPPWGALVAVDLDTGKKRWEVPLGATLGPDGKKIPGEINAGGAMITAGGLVFIAATRSDEMLRAFDVETGKLLWEGALPAGGQATPMTYRAANGKQYVVIAAGGSVPLGSKMGDSVVAFALP